MIQDDLPFDERLCPVREFFFVRSPLSTLLWEEIILSVRET